MVLKLVNLVLSATLDYVPELHNAALIGLQKPAGVRPIAVGEAWYRVASRAAVMVSAAGSGLKPIQFGADIPGGSSCLGHALRAGLQADAGCVTVQVDFRSAFDSIFREWVLEAVQQRTPQLLPLVQWACKSVTT